MNDFRIANINLIWCLVIPILVFLINYYKSHLQELTLRELFDEQIIKAQKIIYASFKKTVLLKVVTSFLLVFALLQPQWGFNWVDVPKLKSDIIIALDVSESMLAEDIRPSRLLRAKSEIVDILSKTQGQRFGLISFAGAAYVEMPLTLDFEAFKIFLDSLSPDVIPIKGTNIEFAVKTAAESFNQAGKISENLKRTLIIITDGESFSGDPRNVSNILKENKINVYIIGIGTEEGAPIPGKNGFKLNKQGKTVISRLNSEGLKKIAKDTNGVFISLSSAQKAGIEVLYSNLNEAEAQYTSGKAKKYIEWYQLPLLFGMIMLLITHTRFSTAIFLLFLLLYPQTSFAEPIEKIGKEALDLYNKGNFVDALSLFRKGAAVSPEDFRFKVSEGATLYRLGNFQQAHAIFHDAASKAASANEKATALYNSGNSLVQMNSLKEAIKEYEEALKLTPEDKEIKDNLEYAKKLLEEQRQEENKNEEQEENKEQPKNEMSQEKNNSKNEEGKDNSTAKESKQGEENNNKQSFGENEKDTSKEDGEQNKQLPLRENYQKQELESLLNTVEEKSGKKTKYRIIQGEKQLQTQEQELPEEDW